jgi:hypothetical protein
VDPILPLLPKSVQGVWKAVNGHKTFIAVCFLFVTGAMEMFGVPTKQGWYDMALWFTGLAAGHHALKFSVGWWKAKP